MASLPRLCCSCWRCRAAEPMAEANASEGTMNSGPVADFSWLRRRLAGFSFAGCFRLRAGPGSVGMSAGSWVASSVWNAATLPAKLPSLSNRMCGPSVSNSRIITVTLARPKNAICWALLMRPGMRTARTSLRFSGLEINCTSLRGHAPEVVVVIFFLFVITAPRAVRARGPTPRSIENRPTRGSSARLRHE